jgi:hypothetical protein
MCGGGLSNAVPRAGCPKPQAATSSRPVGGLPTYRADLASHLRVLHAGAFTSYLVLCESSRAAQRLQRTLNTALDLF